MRPRKKGGRKKEVGDTPMSQLSGLGENRGPGGAFEESARGDHFPIRKIDPERIRKPMSKEDRMLAEIAKGFPRAITALTGPGSPETVKVGKFIYGRGRSGNIVCIGRIPKK